MKRFALSVGALSLGLLLAGLVRAESPAEGDRVDLSAAATQAMREGNDKHLVHQTSAGHQTYAMIKDGFDGRFLPRRSSGAIQGTILLPPAKDGHPAGTGNYFKVRLYVQTGVTKTGFPEPVLKPVGQPVRALIRRGKARFSLSKVPVGVPVYVKADYHGKWSSRADNYSVADAGPIELPLGGSQNVTLQLKIININ